MRGDPTPAIDPELLAGLAPLEAASVLALVQAESVCTPLGRWMSSQWIVHGLVERGWLEIWDLDDGPEVTLTDWAANHLEVEIGEQIVTAYIRKEDEDGTYSAVEMEPIQRWYRRDQVPPIRIDKGRGYVELPYPDRVEAPAPEPEPEPMPRLELMGVLATTLKPKPGSKKRRKAKAGRA